MTTDSLSFELRVRARRMRALIGKELRQLARDRVLLGFIVYIFTLHLVVTTSGLSWELRETPVIVADRDRTMASREFLAGLRHPYFSLEPDGADPGRALGALDSGEARLYIEIPAGFEEALRRGTKTANVQVLVDGSHVTRASLAAAYTARRAQELGAEYARARLSRLGSNALPVIASQERTFYNFALDDHWPGSLAMLLTMLTVACVVLPAAAALREKERGTIEQLLVTPVTPLEIMFSKTLAMVLVSVAGTALAIYAVMQPIFDVPLRGSAALFFALTALFAFANAGIGLFLSTLARNSAQVGLLVILTMLPMIELSGTFTPVESMPPALAAVMNLSPLTHFVRLAFGIAFRGEGVGTLWAPIAALAGVAAGWFLLGLWRFRRQFS